MTKNNLCIKCNSSNFVKHGLTSAGVQRFRCLDCTRTWVASKEKTSKIDLTDIALHYLDGKSIRQLVKYYQTSPVRINQQIRAFFDECPDWNLYVDNHCNYHKPKQIFITGKKFHCSWRAEQKNEMFVAFAIDSMTNFILGYTVACGDSSEVWFELFDSLKNRNITTSSFLTNGSEKSMQALEQVYPNTDMRISYHKSHRDKELSCCLSRMTPSEKLMTDASKIYFLNENVKLAQFLGINNESALLNFIVQNNAVFTDILTERLISRTKLMNDNLPTLFQKRFEKFHLLRENPLPIINSWIANQMLQPDKNGLTKFALYTQQPFSNKFKHFAKNKTITVKYDKSEIPFLQRLLIEVVARGLELPLHISDCNFNKAKCSLVV